MNPDDNHPLDQSSPVCSDAQDAGWNNSASPESNPSTTTDASTPSTIIYEMEIEQEIPASTGGTICLSGDDDSQIEAQQQKPDELSQDWAPLAASTPLLAAAAADNHTRRSEREIENELFHNIEGLVRTFLARPNREYPYYRIMRWTDGEDVKLEHVLTVVINRPVVLLEHQ